MFSWCSCVPAVKYFSSPQGIELQGDGLGVGAGAAELDGPREAVMVFPGPPVPFPGQDLEGRRFQVHLLLGDHQLQAALALFQVHQGGQGYADGLPVRHRPMQVLDGRHVAGGPVGQQAVGGVPQVVGVVAVELGGEGAPAVIAVIVVLGAEDALVNALGPLFAQVGGHHLQEDALGVHQGKRKVAVAVPGQQQAPLQQGREAQEDPAVVVPPDVAVVDELHLVFIGELVEGLPFVGLPVVGRDDVADLDDQDVDFVDELQDALGDQDGAVIFPQPGPLHHHVGDEAHHLVDGQLVFFDLLADEDDVGMGLEGHLQGDVGGAAAHEAVEMPVLQVRLAVGIEVADLGGKGHAGRVVAEGNLQEARDLEVAVDGLGDADDLGAQLPQILRQEGGVGVGVVAPHHHQAVQLEGGAGLPALLHLLGGVDLVPAGAQHVEAAGVFVRATISAVTSRCWLVMMPLGPARKPMSTLSGWSCLAASKTPAMTLCPPGAGPAGEDDAQAPGLGGRLAAGDDFHQPVLADEGQLLPGHLEDFQFKAVQGPGCGPGPRPGLGTSQG